MTTKVDAAAVAKWAAEQRFAQLSYGDVAYVDRGIGPIALFIHGFPLNGFQWRDCVTALADFDRRCIVPDMLAMGRTRVKADRGVGFEDQVVMLVELLDALAVSAADIVASDSGTGVALLLAARHPRRVRSLLLTNGDVEIDSPPAALLPIIALAQEGKLADEFIIQSLASKDFTRSGHGFAGLTYTDPSAVSDQLIDAYFGPLVETEERRRLVDAYALAFLPNPLAGIEDELQKVKAPARMLWGTGDTVFRRDGADYLNRIFPNSLGVRRLEGAKLFWPEEMPEIVIQEAKALWKRRP